MVRRSRVSIHSASGIQRAGGLDHVTHSGTLLDTARITVRGRVANVSTVLVNGIAAAISGGTLPATIEMAENRAGWKL